MQKYFYFVTFLLCLYGCNGTDTQQGTSMLKGNQETEMLENNQILELVLTQDYKDGDFTVVEPQSSTGMDEFDASTSKRILDQLKESTSIPPEILTKLVDTFVRKNTKQVALTLKSKPEKGYFVDYEGKFEKYFKKDGGGWELWRKENPKAHCSTSVSLPAYDKEYELILVYIGQQCDWLMGEGNVVLFKKEGQKLQILGAAMLWIS